MNKLSIIIPVWNQEELVIKALDNIPRRDDIEVLVRDDGSSDNTLDNLIRYSREHRELKLRVFYNNSNMGVAYTKNRLLESATGEYVHIHDSDDYVLTDEYNRAISELDGSDVVLFDLKINDGRILNLTLDSCNLYCAQIARFIRREFIDGIQFPEHIRAADDWYFHNDMMERNPTQKFTGIVAYHYNYPRVGSLSDLKVKGLI